MRRLVRFEAFTTSSVKEIFSSSQTCQLVENDQCFGGHLYHHHQDLMRSEFDCRAENSTETSAILSQLTRFITDVLLITKFHN
jgi:hypothetical protein